MSISEKFKNDKMKLKYFSIILLGLVLFSSCSKEEFDSTEEINGNIDPEIVDCELKTSILSDLTNATLLAEAIDGMAPFEYKWSDGQNSESIDVTDSGVYSVEITDSAGCVSSFSSAVDIEMDCDGEIFGLMVTHDPINMTLTAQPTGNNYVVMWSNGEFTETISVTTGVYEVEVVNSVGCVLWISYEVL